MNQSLSRKPVEAAYIPQARRVIVAQALKAKAIEEEHSAKLACARVMNSTHVKDFDVTVEDSRYHVRLARPEVEVVSPKKLYVLVKEGEISVEDFLECVSVNEDAVADLVGESRVPSLKERQKRGLNLIIRKRP